MNKLLPLLRNIRECQLCVNHLPLNPRPILQAHHLSRVLIVGQTPGIRVHNTGIPWNDPSGDRLRHWMQLDKKTFYDTNQIAIIPMGFCYPGTGPSGDLPPRKECARTWLPKLLANLPNIQLTLLIGQYAQKHYLGNLTKPNLTETVASYLDYLPAFFPLPHPSPRNNIWLKRHSWFEKIIIPALRSTCATILNTPP
ncbi:MAG: uracil-DNA glycosylase family protein [Gammaproteobacteria bacterium]|nr:MAG: uracil-DNA glycosylase family protein [Gammaproteobacteria bacterium]